MLAARRNHVDIVDALLTHDADVNIRDLVGIVDCIAYLCLWMSSSFELCQSHVCCCCSYYLSHHDGCLFPPAATTIRMARQRWIMLGSKRTPTS